MSTHCLSICYDNAARQSKNNPRNSNVYLPRRGFFPTQACTFTVSVDANAYLSDTWLLGIQADSYKHIHLPGRYTILCLNKDCSNIR